MVNRNSRVYPYYTITETINAYGEKVVSATYSGEILIDIQLNEVHNTSDVLYSQYTYKGLTKANVDDTMIIDKKYKVERVNPFCRNYNIVYMVDWHE